MPGSAQIYEGPDAGVASDHRLIYASFRTPTVGSAPIIAGNPKQRLMLTGVLLALVLVAGGIAIVVARRELLDPES